MKEMSTRKNAMASTKVRSKSNHDTVVRVERRERRCKSPIRSHSRESNKSSENEFDHPRRLSSSRPPSRRSSDCKSREYEPHTAGSREGDKISNQSQQSPWTICSTCLTYSDIVQWFQRFNHDVENVALQTENDLRNFFCLVMSAKCVQLLVILVTIHIPMYSSTVHDFLHENHNYWVGIPFGCAFIVGTVVRIFTVFKTLQRQLHVLLFTVVTLGYAYSMSSLSEKYDNLIIQKVFLLLTPTCMFLVLFVFTGNISVVKKILYIAATSSVIFFATTMSLLPPIFQANPNFELSIDVWLPAVIATEILIFLIIFEMQSILAGDRVTITKNDWIYLAIYL